MADKLMGAAVRRKEDYRFLTGRGTYTDDITLPDQAFAYIIRSPHAAADVGPIDTSAAAALPGVLAVLTGNELAADGIGGLPCGWQVHNRDGTPMAEPPHPPLATGRVRHVGDCVALVVADSYNTALDAAGHVRIEYHTLPSVTNLAAAVEPEAPRVWEDVERNVCFDWEVGDQSATDDAFKTAARVVRLDLVQNRITASPMEPRSAIGVYDSVRDEYTLYTSTQNPHVIRVLMATGTLNVPEERVRVISPDVGGGFGMKIYHYAEEVLVAWASRRVGRPVKWVASRSEAFLSDTCARDHVTTAELALDSDGRFIGLIPIPNSQNRWAQSRRPMVMMCHG